MGCDIHPVIEYRHKGGDHWWSFSGEMNWDRCYQLFELMAGVRCYAEGGCSEAKCNRMIVAPRGWPNGSHLLVFGEYRGSDLHTPSWLTLIELREVVSRLTVRMTELDATIAAMAVFEGSGMDTRLVFAFDN